MSVSCLIHHKAFRADYISRSTKICAPTARIPAVAYCANFNTSKHLQINICPNCRCAAVSR